MGTVVFSLCILQFSLRDSDCRFRCCIVGLCGTVGGTGGISGSLG